MKEYEFTLKYLLPESETNPEVFVSALQEAGCDDALVGIGQPGRIALEFIREANSAFEAIASALAQVKKAIPGAQLVEATPDFVGLTDVAKIIGCSRQNMLKLVRSNLHTFPIPIHEGSASIWNLYMVLSWLSSRESYRIDHSLVEISKTTMEVNAAKYALRIGHDVQNFQALI